MNRLAAETSPYLLQHADNPVDWYPWGDEALTRARAEDTPILLSVGYAACHWCHVMEHESFEDDATAALMNEHFVCVKVDREERPDVDSVYMDAVVSLTGHGRLADDGLPDAGREAVLRRHVLPARAAPRPAELPAVAARGRRRLARAAQRDRARCGRDHRGAEARSATVARAAGAVAACRCGARVAPRLRPAWGGFGKRPKFPPASALEFLLRREELELVTKTLDSMALGGMYDLVGGGFHRYSVDREWLVPHFEKMLYDNALLVPRTCTAGSSPARARTGGRGGDVEYMLRELALPEGGFASAQDADTDGVEG
jgi:uncharacterized protein YyaL (SSP411 family)